MSGIEISPSNIGVAWPAAAGAMWFYYIGRRLDIRFGAAARFDLASDSVRQQIDKQFSADKKMEDKKNNKEIGGQTLEIALYHEPILPYFFVLHFFVVLETIRRPI